MAEFLSKELGWVEAEVHGDTLVLSGTRSYGPMCIQKLSVRVDSVHILGVSQDHSSRILWFFKDSKAGLALDHITCILPADEEASSQLCRFLADIESRAYETHRRLLCFVNPISGKGKGKELWERKIEPVLKVAPCEFTLVFTGPRGAKNNPEVYLKDADLGSTDVIVTVGGDGVVHEVLNGLHARGDNVWKPIAPIASGSGNAVAVNLYGPEKFKCIYTATLSALKGKNIPLKLLTLTQGETRRISFLSQAFGLMADLDIQTEHLRFLGSNRFVYGYLKGVFSGRRYKYRLDFELADMDKENIGMQYCRLKKASSNVFTPSKALLDATERAESPTEGSSGETAHSNIPPTTSLDVFPRGKPFPGPGWYSIESECLFLYAGVMPYVASDAMLFPATQGDDCVDIAILDDPGIMPGLQCMDGMERGAYFYRYGHYLKVRQYWLTPLEADGILDIDGEAIPHEPFHARVTSLASVCSLTGKFEGAEHVDLKKE